MPGLARALANALLGALETRRHLVFENLALLQAFFLDILAGEMSEDERRERGFTFINTDEAPPRERFTPSAGRWPPSARRPRDATS